MKIAHILLVAFVLVLACACFAGEDQLTVTQYGFSTTWRERAPDGKITETASTSSMYQAADGRIRQEIASKSSRHVVELFGATSPGEKPRGMYVLDLDKKTYYLDVVSGLHPGPPPEPYTELSNDLGDKSIQGLACHGYGGTSKKSEYIENWSCRFPNSRMTFMGELLMRYTDGSGYHLMLTKVTPNTSASAAMFEIPSDFRAALPPRQNIPSPPGAPDQDRGYYFGPIPNWGEARPGGGVEVFSIPLKPCGIFEKQGKTYRYVAGEVPPEIWGGKEKHYSGNDVKKITDAGGMVKLLPHGFSQGDLEKQKTACDDWYHQQAKEYMKSHPIH